MVGALSERDGASRSRWDGRVKPGTVLSIIAPPMSQSGALIRILMRERPTTYITTVRGRDAVEAELAAHPVEGVSVVAVDERRSMDAEFVRQLTGKRADSLSGPDDFAVLDETYEAIAGVGDSRSTVVIDPVNPLEHTGERGAYRETLNALKSTVLRTDGVGVVHCLDADRTPAMRDITLNVADVVWKLAVGSDATTREYQLTIPKNRGGPTVLDPISLVMDAEVSVDESRNI